MKTASQLLVLAGLLFLSGCAHVQNQQAENKKVPDKHFYVFLCFGQSNMEGFPGIEPQDKGPVDERFQVLAAVDFPGQGRTNGNWYPAVPPLCRPGAGLCPADYFGRTFQCACLMRANRSNRSATIRLSATMDFRRVAESRVLRVLFMSFDLGLRSERISRAI